MVRISVAACKYLFNASTIVFAILLLFTNCLNAQCNPEDDEIIYQNQLILSIPPQKNVHSYQFTIEETGYVTESRFAAIFIDNLEFGNTYNWSVVIRFSDSTVKTEKHRFSVAPLDKNIADLSFRVIDHKARNICQPGLVMLDFTGVAINRQGKICWFLNRNQDILKDKNNRPLTLTRQGTVLMTSNEASVECELNGNLLWRSPENIDMNGKSVRNRNHHEVQKLKDNSYLSLIKCMESRKISGLSDSLTVVTDAVIILDKSGNVTWSWKLADQISAVELNQHYARERPNGGTHFPFGEVNSAYLDEEKKLLYLGIRDISTILVISYPSGKILSSYGLHFNSALRNYKNIDFKEQHGGVPDKNGNIWVFNNNGENQKEANSEVLLIAKESKSQNAEILYRFNCGIDGSTPGKTARLGYVSPLKYGSVLVCMGYAGRIFEVDSLKNISWDCIIESAPAITSANTALQAKANYRAYFYPSLYPYQFTAQASLKKQDLSLSFINLGFNDDSYSIYLKEGDKRKLLAKVSSRSGDESTISLKLPRKADDAYLEVESSGSGKILKLDLR